MPHEPQRGAAPGAAVEIRRLDVRDVEDYRAIRLAALEGEPDAFGSTYDSEATRPLSTFAGRLATSVVWGACTDAGVVGMAGFTQDAGQKHCHKGFVWGLYVRPAARRQGIATALVETLLASAAEMVEHVTVSVVQGNDAAMALYRRFGFEVYGVEPRALKGAAGYADEVLMVRLPPPA